MVTITTIAQQKSPVSPLSVGNGTRCSHHLLHLSGSQTHLLANWVGEPDYFFTHLNHLHFEGVRRLHHIFHGVAIHQPVPGAGQQRFLVAALGRHRGHPPLPHHLAPGQARCHCQRGQAVQGCQSNGDQGRIKVVMHRRKFYPTLAGTPHIFLSLKILFYLLKNS